MLILGVAAALVTLSAESSDFIHPPPGWKPVFLKNPDGSWIQALVPEGSEAQGKIASLAVTTPAAVLQVAPVTQFEVDANGTPTGESVAPLPTPAATASPRAENSAKAELDKILDTAVAGLDWKRELTAIPAFVALDISPETIARPTTPRDLAASLLNGVDRKGILQSGLAVETAPYQIFVGPETSLEDYRHSYLTRLLYRTSVSLATVKAGSGTEDQALRLALGLSMTLFDAGDPYCNEKIIARHDEILSEYDAFSAGDIAQDIRSDMNDDEAIHTAIEANARVKAWENKKNEANRKFISDLKEIRQKEWGTSAWNIAGAPAWISTTGKTDDLKWDGFTAWSTFAYGFENTAVHSKMQFFAHFRYRQDEHLVDADDPTKTADEDSLLAAASLRFHVEKQHLNLAVEAAYLNTWNGLKGDGSVNRIGGVLEKKISDNVWLVISLGQDFGSGGKENELFALSSLRFGTTDQGRFAP